jgi:peptidoglycan/LPS O-acetylase OafA/YrhL
VAVLTGERTRETVTSGGPPGDRPSHIRGLDGLRALAVIAVLLFHGGVGSVPGGFLGVDMFFVISGFLITGLLLRERDRTGTIRLAAFWGRRARRLLPALVLVVAAVVAYAVLTGAGSDLLALRADAFATAFYVANWHFITIGTGYFAQYADPSPLMHTWSLSIEEQFYLVWPLVLVGLMRRYGTSRAARLCGTLAAAGVVLSAAWMWLLAGTGADPGRLYYGTDTRAQDILIGALLASLLHRRSSGRRPAWLRQVASRRVPQALATAVAVLGGYLCLRAMLTWSSDQPGLYRGGLTLFALSCFLLIAGVVVHPTGLVARALEVAPLKIVGLLSYGIYLWHWPVFLAVNHEHTGLTGIPLLVLRLLVTATFATLSYVLVERPVRDRAVHIPRPRVLLPVAALGAMALLVVCTAGGSAAGQLPVDQPAAQPAAQAATQLAAQPAATPAQPAVQPAVVLSSTKPVATPSASPAGGPPMQVLFLGDSTALTLAGGVASGAPSGTRVVNEATLGCGVTTLSTYEYFGSRHVLPDQCRTWQDTWRSAVSRHPPDVVAVLVGRWEVMDRQLGGVWTHVGNADMNAYLRGQLEQAFAVASSSGARVAFLTAPYYHRGERPDGGSWPEDDPARVDAFNQLLASVVAAHPGHSSLIALGAQTSGGQRQYEATVDGVTMRYDGVHFTPAADRWLAPWLFTQLRAAL